MIKYIPKKDAQELYDSASTHVPAGTVKHIVNNTKPQQPKKIDFTKIIASRKGKDPK